MTRVLSVATYGFPVWVVIASLLAMLHPPLFTWMTKPMMVAGLGVIMLGMGMTLTLDDFRRVLRLPRAVFAGVACQFTVMPLLGWSIAHGLGLDKIDPHLALGLILVSCCPGGTASNVVAFLARANVALSVSMTLVSTFAAVILTPVMTKALAGALVPVDAWALFKDTVFVVLVPVLAGVGLNAFAPKFVKRVTPAAPLVSVAVIVLIVAAIFGLNRENIASAGWRLLAAPFLLHAGAFALGYAITRLLGFDEGTRRAVSIEVGMQNSGLGATLARAHFPGTPAPVPCAISAAYHCVIGSLLAAFWRRTPEGAKGRSY